MTDLASQFRRHIQFVIFSAGALLFGLGYAIGAEAFIDTMSIVVAIMAIAATWAYAPRAFLALRHPISPSDVLAIGILLACVSTIIGRTTIIAGYLFDMPWVFRSHWVSAVVAFLCISMLCHLMAHHAIEGTVPRRSAIKIGFIVAVSIAVAVTLTQWQTIRAGWFHRSGIAAPAK